MHFKKKIIWIIFVMTMGVSPLHAQIPGLINFQGKLLDTSNNPKNGTFSMVFSIYSVATGGSSLWTETQPSVAVTNGVFSAQLGAVTTIPSTVFSSSPTYLEVDIAGQAGNPRQQLVTSPYAFASADADTATVALVAQNLVPGTSNYIQNTQTLQSGGVFYVSSGTIAGPFAAAGIVTLGSIGNSGGAVTISSNATITGNLTASGAGPHIFTGDIHVTGNAQINGGNLNDSTAVSRITLGDPLIINAGSNGLGVPNGQPGVMFSTSIFLNGNSAADNYVAYPFSAQTAIAIGNAVTLQGGGVGTVAVNTSAAAIGFAVTSATAGQTVWVATTGIITEAVSGGAIAIGATLCTSSSAAGRIISCTTVRAGIGKAITGTTAAGQTLAVMIIHS